MDLFKLYSVNDDGSKTLLSEHASLEDAEAAQVDDSKIYSVEKWDGSFATVLY